MNEFNFRVANAAPRASGFEIGQNVGDTKTTYIYSYKTKYINGKSTGQKTNVDWYMESSIPFWVSVKYVFEGNDCKVTFTTLQKNTGSSARTHTLVMGQMESGETISFPIWQQAAAAEQDITFTIHGPRDTNTGYFFKEGQTPPSDSTGTTYFGFPVLDGISVHKYKKSKGIRVNLREGNTEMAYPGDRISAYRFTKAWQLMRSFILPSSDQSIPLL